MGSSAAVCAVAAIASARRTAAARTTVRRVERGQRVAVLAVSSMCAVASFALLYLGWTRYDDDALALTTCSVLAAGYGLLALHQGWRAFTHAAWEAAGRESSRAQLLRTLYWILLLPLPLLAAASHVALRRAARWSIGPANLEGDRVREARYEAGTERLWVFTDRAVYIGEIDSGHWRIPYTQIETWIHDRSERGIRLTLASREGARTVSGTFTGGTGQRIERLLCRVMPDLRSDA